MTRLFLHFLNLAATFRIWSSDKMNALNTFTTGWIPHSNIHCYQVVYL